MTLLLLVLACDSASTDDTSAAGDDTAVTDTVDTADSGDTDTDTASADADADGYLVPEDCDDTNAQIHPGAPELCDDQDNNCDGATDEATATDATAWYADADGDTFGDSATSEVACAAPTNYVADNTDCDDGDATVPDAQGFCTVPYTTVYGSQMVVIPAGTFSMGSGAGDVYGNYPDHDVTLTHSFWMGKSEVTQSAWAEWTSTTPTTFTGDDLPMESVSWTTIALYANALSTSEGLTLCYEPDGSAMAAAYLADPYTCPGYRLPTDAEWEYAARAGEDTKYAGSSTAADVAWTGETSDETTHDVCGLAPNAWGLCDMSGNVVEWTNDWDSGSLDDEAVTDPAGPSSGYYRAVRGGSFGQAAVFASVAFRASHTPSYGYTDGGFRLARTSLPR